MAAAESACPICKHSPLVTNASKALRATARNFLKIQMANAESSKAVELTPSAAPESKEPSVAAQEELKTPITNGKTINDDREPELPVTKSVREEAEQSDEVVQSIEVSNYETTPLIRTDSHQMQRETSRRPTIVSASGNEPDDDDIEINVGLGEYDLSQIAEGSKRTPVDDMEQWPEEQAFEKSRKNSTLPQVQAQSQNSNQSFNGTASFNDFESSGMGQNMNNMQNDQQFWDMMQSGGMNNMSKTPVIS